MTSFTITVQDQDVQALLQKLQGKVGNMSPVLTAIGEQIVERTKARFASSTAPDGSSWKPNSAATLGLLSARLGKSHSKKDGSLNARGQANMANKKPLIGESGDLRRQIIYRVAGDALTISATARYAAIQQFGGKAGRGHKVTIPARPFLPVLQDGGLYPQEQRLVLEALNDFLAHGL
jgi:phage virion morphogenesis protein